MGCETKPNASTSLRVEEKTMKKQTVLQALGAAACAFALALPLSAAPHAKTERTMAWAPETLSGQIMMVEPAQHLVVVKGPDGVPFDIRVTPSTAIRANGQRQTLQDLRADIHNGVSVRFTPEGRGDVARSIHVKG
jgi:hypothetical protein